MSEKKVRGIPWMTKISSWYQFSDGLYPGWHPGQRVLNTESRNTWNSSGYVTIEGTKWWGDRDSNMGKWNVENLFNTTGVSTRLNNGTRHNTLHFVGGFTENTSWLNDSAYYFTSSESSMVRNAIGFSVQSNCAGSHSDGGGSSQAFLEKVGLFYAHPETRKRYGFVADQKVSGDHSLNQSYPDHSDKYYTYRISSSDINFVHDNKLVLMSMGFQFVHTAKSMARDSKCNLFNLRIMVGDGTGLVDNNYTSRILIVDRPERTLNELYNGANTDIGY